jgi:hypothetical protein
MANLIVNNPDTGTSYDTGVDISKVNAIPNLEQVANNTYRIPGLGTEALMRQIVSQTINNAIADPIAFEKNTLKNYTKNLVSAENFRGVPGEKPPDKQQLIDAAKASINYLAGNKVSASDITSLINTSVQEYSDFQKMAADKIASMNAADGTGGTGGLKLVIPVAVALALPGAGAALATQLGVSAAVGTALVSTAYQVSQGADFDTAIKNATINAVTQSGSQDIAKDIASTVGKVGADAITSAGASITSTLAKGGSMSDAVKNAGAALVASSVSSATDSRAIGAATGGALTGGTKGAIVGAASEIGKPTPEDKGKQVASVGDITKDPNVVSDSPVSDLGEITITAPKDNVQVVSPTPTPAPTPAPAPTPSKDQKVIDLITPPAPVTPPPVTPKEPVTEIPEIVITAPKTSKDDVQVVSPDAPPSKDKTTTPPATTKTPEIPAEPTDTKETPKDPNLYIYSSTSPTQTTVLSKSLGTDLPFYPGSAVTTGLTSTRGAGEIDGQETGGKRRNVWNEASLRLKDALGI